MSWRKFKLGEIFKARDKVFEPDDPSLFSLSKINKITFEGEIIEAKYTATKTKQILVEPGDLVFSGLNIEKGAIAINNTGKTLVVSTNYSSFETDYTKVDAEFLEHYFKSKVFNQILRASLRKDYSFTKPKQFVPIEINLPCLDEQRKLAIIFRDKRKNFSLLLNAFNDGLEIVRQIRQAFLREAMQGKLVEQCLKDEPAKVLLERIKFEKTKLIAEKKINRDKSLPEIEAGETPFVIPDTWVWCRLGDICEFTNGKAHEQYISEAGEFVLVNSRFVSTSGNYLKYSSRQLTPLSKNDIAIVMSDVPSGRALGRCYLVEKNDAYTLNQRIGGVRALEGADSKYLSFILDRNQHFLSYDDGKKQTNLKKDQILSCPVPLPPLAEQKRIVEKLERLMTYCEELEKSIQQSKSQVEMLLQTSLKEALQG